MKKGQFYLHDLNNKLSLLYGLLTLSQRGSPIPPERLDALKSRINEIVRILQNEAQLDGQETFRLTKFNYLDFHHFLTVTISKLKAIYSGLSIHYSSVPETWDHHHLVLIEKELLYQAIENAVENAFNAQSEIVKFHLSQKQNRVVLEISDNGRGFQDIENANKEQMQPQAHGMDIIKDNLKRMGAQVVYAQNNPTGIRISFQFLTA